MKKYIYRFLVLWFAFFISYETHAQDFTIVSSALKTGIVYDAAGSPTDSVTAHLLAKDIEQVTGYLPKIYTDLSAASGNAIIIGNYKSALIASVCTNKYAKHKTLAGKWECYLTIAISNPVKNISNALLIIGSDARGTAYGVFSVSEKIGVSPWYWWADVPVNKKQELIVDGSEFIAEPPSVKYRGIFLNDEDWGLQPWAAKTFETETGDIGPKTYARIFELLLRLKANLIWPAMHPCTKAFYSYEQNKNIAADYSIIVGSSHAEPMLRNNVGEWNSKTMGDFNYITNQQTVYKYWEDRIKESRINDVIYTLGMRGVHDSGIEGVKNAKEAVPLVTSIIDDQRKLLSKYINPKVNTIPQAFTVYKEVLEIYDNGLKIPDDITLVWPDDNYGYIQRLNNESEKKRTGGSGIYYHASYWGRPHDYLWLSSTHPALIREEMMKAYDNRSNKLWVLNVGDIKPLEYNITLFLDMAYDIKPFTDSRYCYEHFKNWHGNIFGKSFADAIGSLMWEYYQLAFERRPEFMGWSQTEPTTKTTLTAYNHFYYGDEAQQRIDKYNNLEKQAKALQSQIDKTHQDAFYELVYYPAVGASLMNKKFVYRDKAFLYSRQNRLSARDYAALSKKVYDSMVTETAYFNNTLAGGKWKNIMSMKPRNLPVFDTALIITSPMNRLDKWNIIPEGYGFNRDQNKDSLPAFNSYTRKKYFVDIFLCDSITIDWKATVSEPWIKLSATEGTLLPEPRKTDSRIWVEIDWSKVPKKEKITGQIIFEAAGKKIPLEVTALNYTNSLNSYNGAIEDNGYISLFATSFSRKKDKAISQWILYPGLGHTGNALLAQSDSPTPITDTLAIKEKAASVEYNFYTFTDGAPIINIYSLPTHPLNTNFSMRYAIQLNDGPLQFLDFKTIGRSEEWKQNVLNNQAVKTAVLPFIKPGMQTLKIYVIDPGVLLDRITISMGGLQPAFGVIPETKMMR